MKLTLIWMLFVLAVVGLALSEVEERSVPDGTIYGHVYDAATNKPLANALVYCQDINIKKQFTKNDGYYAINGGFAPLSPYIISCTVYGYIPAVINADTDQYGNALADFNLEPEAVIAPVNETEINISNGAINITPTENITNETEIVALNLESVPSLSNLQFIWSFSGIEPGSVTMALNQEGTDLFGQAKYEPDGEPAWNAEVIGSVNGDEFELTMTSQKGEEMVTTKMDGVFANEGLNGSYTQVSGGKVLKRGRFDAIWICPGTSSYTPAIIDEIMPATSGSSAINGESTQGSGFVDVRQFLDKIGPGGDLSGVPPDETVAAAEVPVVTETVVAASPVTGPYVIMGMAQDNTQASLEGWNFYLSKDGAVVDSATSGADGKFNFVGLTSGVYTVTETLEDGWRAVSPENGTTEVTIDTASVIDVVFVNQKA